MVADGTDDGAGGIAGNGAGGRCFAIAFVAGIGQDFHNYIFHRIYRAECGFERHAQGNGKSIKPDVNDFHTVILPPGLNFAKGNPQVTSFPVYHQRKRIAIFPCTRSEKAIKCEKIEGTKRRNNNVPSDCKAHDVWFFAGAYYFI